MKHLMTVKDTTGLVVKANDLIEAGFSLTLAEQNLILQAITKIDRGNPVNSRTPYVVTAEEMRGKTGFADSDDAYRALRETAEHLWERTIVLKHEKGTRRLRWIFSCDYQPSGALVEMKFSPDIVPFLSELSERFTTYRVGHVDQMKSVYGPRLYELLMQWRDTGQRELTLTEIRRCFNIGDNYHAMCDFKKRVIDPAVKDINKYSDHTVSYTQRKQGRNVVALIFKYNLKPEYITNR